MEPKQQPPYPLRMPPELREALEKEAALVKRSLNAEIVGRLEESLGRQKNTLPSGSETQLTVLQSRAEAYELRLDLVRSRLDGLDVRRRLIGIETERMTRNAKTDDDFAQVKASAAQLAQIEAEAKQAQEHLQFLCVEREATAQKIAALLALGRGDAAHGMRNE